MSWVFRGQSNCVVSSVPNIMEITASNFSKQRPLLILTGPIEFPENTNLIRTVQIQVHVVHIHKFIKLIDWLAWILSLGSHYTPHMLNVQGISENFRTFSEIVRGKRSSKIDTMIWGRSMRPIYAIPSQIEYELMTSKTKILQIFKRVHLGL